MQSSRTLTGLAENPNNNLAYIAFGLVVFVVILMLLWKNVFPTDTSRRPP